MNQNVCAELAEDKFEAWAGNCEHLVCDYEKCLRTDFSVRQLTKANLKLVDPYPRSSQDFNAIENAWKLLRDRLNETLPKDCETRDQFVKRLVSAVAWVNRNKKADLWYFQDIK